MSPVRWALVGIAIAAIGLVVLWRSKEPARSTGAGPSTSVAVSAAPLAPLTKEARDKILRDSPEAHLADDLNQPSRTIQEDLAIVGSLIAAYRSNYSGRGNPIGDNREITDTMLGQNPNGIIFLRTGHRAINAKGELCDRWGIPFFFHAESARKMEIRSAGPDKVMWSADDVVIVP